MTSENSSTEDFSLQGKLMAVKIFQMIAVVLMGVQLGVSSAHFMQMPGMQ